MLFFVGRLSFVWKLYSVGMLSFVWKLCSVGRLSFVWKPCSIGRLSLVWKLSFVGKATPLVTALLEGLFWKVPFFEDALPQVPLCSFP